LLLILTKYEIIIFAAGPAEMKNIRFLWLAILDIFESNDKPILSQLSTKLSGIGKNLYAQDIFLLILHDELLKI